MHAMKRINSIVMLFAAVAMAFVSCQKQEITAPEDAQEVVLSFVSEKPSFADETKTEWTGTTVQWSAGDRISVAYTVNGAWQNASGNASGDAKLYKSDQLTEAAETAQFNVSTNYTGTTEGAHVFYGVYPAPASTNFSEAPVATLEIPAIQTPRAASFDAAADLMTGVSVGEFTSRPAQGETISMKWTRLVAHANITLKSLGVTEGERVSVITLTAQEGANLVGSQKVNLLTGEVTNNNAESNVVEIGGGNLSIDANGNLEFWACCLPATLTSLKVVVETDCATYTREITGIEKTFKQNARNILAVNMESAERVEKEKISWVAVSPADGISTGTYVLVARTSTKTGALITTNGTSAAPTFNTSVSVEDNLLYGVTDAMMLDISGTAGNYKLAVAGQTTDYLFTTATNNGVRVGTSANNVWTIEKHASNSNAFVFKCNATSRYLGVYNNQDWRCYNAYDASNYTNGAGSSQIYLYKRITGDEPVETVPSITVQETLELAKEGASGTVTFTYENLEDLEVSAWADEACTQDCDWLTVSLTEGGLTYVALANSAAERVAYIRINGNDLEGNIFSKVIAVTQEGAPVVNTLTIAEFLAMTAADNVVYTVTGTIVNINEINTTYGNATLTIADEAGNELYIYRMTAAENGTALDQLGLTVGDVLTVAGVWSQYNGSVQLASGVYVSHEDKEAPTVTISNVTIPEFVAAEVSASDWYRLTGRIISIKSISSSYNNAELTISDGTNEILIYRMGPGEIADIADIGLAVGDELTVVGNRGDYNGVAQVVSGYYESHKDGCATPEISCLNNLVEITCSTDGATVYYSVDNAEYVAYSEPVAITADCVVKAYAGKDGFLDSFVATANCAFSDGPAVAEATLTFDDTAKRTVGTTAQQVWVENGITFTNDKASSTSNVNTSYYKPIRLYASSSATVEMNNMVKIIFDCNSASYATTMKTSIGTISGATVSVSSDKVTVEFETPVNSFTIASFTAQVRVDGLAVTYQL